MKKILTPPAILLLLFALSCTDPVRELKPTNTTQIELSEAQQHFALELTNSKATQTLAYKKGFDRRTLIKSAVWSKAYHQTLSFGDALIVPTSFEQELFYQPNQNVSLPISALTYLMFYKGHKNKVHLEVITAVPSFDAADSASGQLFKGMVLAEIWNGDFVKGYVYKEGKTYSVDQLEGEPQQNAMMAFTMCAPWYSCVSSGGADTDTECHYSGEDCVNVYVDEGNGGGDGGIGANPTLPVNDGPMPGGGGAPTGKDYGDVAKNTNLVVNAPSPDEIISDINQYLICFNLNLEAKITIYVEQPTRNSRDTWSGSPLDPEVGHTFVSIQQGEITRMFGYYPIGGVNPCAKTPSATSGLYDDGGHAYDVKIEIKASASQLANVITVVKKRNPTYNLDSYNCTDFGMAVSKAAGYVLPDTSGSWTCGGGSNPGDLGEDIRNLSSNQNVTVTKYSGVSPQNTGSCITGNK
ncbi:MAG: hypothetical protein JST48_05745 [Bacteroidetes bacterium]|nr:hypothetical protein [Bacteroidota bacterium]